MLRDLGAGGKGGTPPAGRYFGQDEDWGAIDPGGGTQ